MTSPQKNMLKKLNSIIFYNSKTYDDLKKIIMDSGEFKKFDSTFNNLLHKGYIQHYNVNNDNSFLMTIKGSKKAKTII